MLGTRRTRGRDGRVECGDSVLLRSGPDIAMEFGLSEEDLSRLPVDEKDSLRGTVKVLYESLMGVDFPETVESVGIRVWLPRGCESKNL